MARKETVRKTVYRYWTERLSLVLVWAASIVELVLRVDVGLLDNTCHDREYDEDDLTQTHALTHTRIEYRTDTDFYDFSIFQASGWERERGAVT